MDQINDARRTLETEGKEQRQRIETLTYELDLVQTQLKEYSSGKSTSDKSLTEYTFKCQSLQRELEDKEQIIAKTTALLDTTKA